MLIEQLPMNGGDTALKTQVCMIRKQIGEDAIETLPGHGYALTPRGMSLVMAAMNPVEMQEPRPV
jgi:hypothetical protein